MRKFLVPLTAVACTLIVGTRAYAQLLPDISSYVNNAAGSMQNTSPSSMVDLLVDSDSYVPPFYRGARVPSPGTNLHLYAFAHFSGASGKPIPDSEITYTWKRNGQVAGQVSGLGKSQVTLPAPGLFATDVFQVDAMGPSGVHGSATITLSSVDPGITLYQDRPLIGIEYADAVVPGTSISGLEMTFAAIPYFVSATNPDDGSLTWSWSVNGAPISATSSQTSELTINAAGSSGLAAISLGLTSKRNYLVDASGQWNVVFSRTSGQ